MSDFTEKELNALVSYWEASKHNPVHSGVFCAGDDRFPLNCRWCQTENIVTRCEIIICPRCDRSGGV